MSNKPVSTRVEFTYNDATNEGNLWQFSTTPLKAAKRVLLVNGATGKVQFEANLIPNRNSFGGIEVKVIKNRTQNALRLSLLQIFSNIPKIETVQINLEKGII